MDLVNLPVVEPDEKISSVLKRMKDARRSAVVVAGGATHAVLELAEILPVLRTAGDVAIANVPGKDEPAGPVMALAALTEAIAEPMGMFKVVSVRGGDAVVVTQHEWIAERVSQEAIICVCQADTNHRWAPSELSPPGYCSLDLSKADCG